MNVSSMNSERKLCVQSTIEKESAVVVLYLHSTSSHNARGKQTSQSLVVLYLHSTSNHNVMQRLQLVTLVVLYLHSTSNHNFGYGIRTKRHVVLYLHSTSNHNRGIRSKKLLTLYYIFILHQTTTMSMTRLRLMCCIISSFYIKPQHDNARSFIESCCIISSFYIKPQQKAEVSAN